MNASERLRNRILERVTEQRRLVRSLLALKQQMRGSLFARYGKCGKPSCTCRTGRGHGPYYVLANAGPGGFAYLEPSRLATARRHVERYKEFKQGLARLRRLNEELVGLLKRYQKSVTHEGGRRLGIELPQAQKDAI